MGDVKNLFGDVPEPKQVLRETSHRHVNDSKLDAFVRKCADHLSGNSGLEITLEDVEFIFAQAMQCRSALKDIEAALAQVKQDDIGGQLYAAFAEQTIDFIDTALGFDETVAIAAPDFGVTPELMPPEIANDPMQHVVQQCPGCMCSSALTRHPFTRIGLARCIKDHEGGPYVST